MISPPNSVATLIKMNLYDYKSEIVLDNFTVFKLNYEQQCNLFGLEYFQLGDNYEVTNYKYSTIKKAKLTGLEDYSKDEKRELIGSEYIILNKKLEDVSFLLEAIRIFKTGYIVATFTEEPSGITHFHYPRFIKVARFGLCKMSVSELKKVEDIFIHLKTMANKKIVLNLDRLKNDPENYNHSYINLIGILESLLTGNDNGELRFRFSLNMNHILKNTIKSKTEISLKIGKELYDIRSQLVHTGQSKKFSVDNYLKLRKITQEILLWFVLNPNYDVEESITNHLNLDQK